MPGGSGKTVLALSAAQAALAQSDSASPLIIVAVPSRELITQTAREWQRWRSGTDKWVEVAVCSGGAGDAARLHRTTDAHEIGLALARGRQERRPVVVYSTYNSLERVAEAMGGREADLVVSDEAHNTAGRPSKFAAFGLDDERLRARRRLFLTATPRLLSARRDADGALVPAGSMDDERLFGPVRHAPP